MSHKFERIGLMIDMSRNAVMSVDALKKFLPLLKNMGYNSVMLYTEDTYEVEGNPYFGYMRGRYSADEIREIDRFAGEIGLELIPCIQTLAHLKQAFKWGTVPMDHHDVLLCDDEETYKLIDDMFKTVKNTFSSNLIHIGMDEAANIGKGEHLKRHGYEKTVTIILRHLKKVCEIAEKHGFKVIMWSDMFFKSASNLGSSADLGITKEELGKLMESVIPVCWDYSPNGEEYFENKINVHKNIFKTVWFAGGLYSWYGFAPLNKFAIRQTERTVSACKKEKLPTYYTTVWGDDGAECPKYANLPSLFYTACLAKGITDESKIKAEFKKVTGSEFDDFLLLDLPNEADETHFTPDGNYPHWPLHPCKYMLYSDYFNDYLDATVTEGVGEKYGELAKKLYEAKKRNRKYGYLFETSAKLCEVYEYKYELGLKTRHAYENGDKETLLKLASEDYPVVKKRLLAFRKAFEKQWMTENKPHGFDIQDLRIGGIIMRTETCRKRILDYVSGKIPAIYELEEKLLPLPDSANIHSGYTFYSSTNVFSHII